MSCKPLIAGVFLSLAWALPAPAAASRSDPARWLICGEVPLFDWLQPISKDFKREDAEATLDAERVDVSGKDLYKFDGAVTLRRADQRLEAEHLEFTHSSQRYRAEDKVRYQDRSIAIAARRADGELKSDRARMEQVSYQLREARGNGEAATIQMTGPIASLDAVTYSTCNPGARTWRMQAETMRLDRESGFGTARNLSLRLGRVPLLWLPWASFPIDDRRKSGFLYPSIGSSGENGLDVRLPYYLNLAPNFDATVTARVLGRRGVMLDNEFRYLLGADHIGEFDASWLPSDDLADRDRGSVRFRHQGSLGSQWRVNADLYEVSDDRYFDDFGDSLAVRSTSLLPSSAGVIGRGRNWRASLRGQNWELIDPLVADTAEPYRQLPRGRIEFTWPARSLLELGFRGEFVNFDHSARAGATRVDLKPSLALNWANSFAYLRPRLAYRHTRYDLDGAYRRVGFADDKPERSLPITSLDTGLFFERSFSWRGSRWLQTLEPRLFYLKVPFEAQDDIPVFDSQELSFGLPQLFRDSRFTGADRQSDANQATFALTSRFFENTGRERFAASLGQIRYFDPPRITLPGVVSDDPRRSALVAEIDWAASTQIRLAYSYQYDSEVGHSTLSGLRGQWRGENGDLINLAWRYRRGLLEQIDSSFALPIASSYRLIGRWNYSLRDKATIESFGGIEWESCCIALRMLGRHYVQNREGDRGNAIYFELELKGLASFGRESSDFLERAIVDYAR